MIVDILSQKRGILSFYDGNKYIIYSQFYGTVAESTKIERSYIEDIEKVNIDFDICYWLGYWDLKSIITKGIKKIEQAYSPKEVTINYNVNYNQQMHLHKHLSINVENY